MRKKAPPLLIHPGGDTSLITPHFDGREVHLTYQLITSKMTKDYNYQSEMSGLEL